jgi:hypothetical protein
MSNFIPPAAISAATNAVVRPANEALRARQLQLKKNAQHAEEIEDLDEQGVDTIRDEQSGGNSQQDHPQKPKTDRVDIASLAEAPPQSPPPAAPSPLSHLDISA